jgi:antirestriction protein ArdC
MSLSTNRPYRGLNVFTLWFTAMEKGYSSPWWGTYKQIQERGGQVRKGEESTQVIWWSIFTKTGVVDGETVTKSFPILKAFRVFNIEQCDWAENAKLPPVAERAQVDPVEAAEALIAGYLADGPSLGHGGDRAFYRPATDQIQMPHLADFEGAEHYYSTLYHEATHSTGHSKRLAREGIAQGTFGRFGDPVYSFEELVAEMGAAMLSAVAGIEQDITFADSAAYIAHWIGALKEDNRVVIRAAAQAQKAVDMILGTTFENDGGE